MTPGPSTPYAPARVRRALTCGAWVAAALYAVQGVPNLALLLHGWAVGSAAYDAATGPLYTDAGWVLACAAFGACHALAALRTGGRAPAFSLLATIVVPPVLYAAIGSWPRGAGASELARAVGGTVTAGLLPMALLVSLVSAVVCRFVMQYWDPAEGTRPAEV